MSQKYKGDTSDHYSSDQEESLSSEQGDDKNLPTSHIDFLNDKTAEQISELKKDKLIAKVQKHILALTKWGKHEVLKQSYNAILLSYLICFAANLAYIVDLMSNLGLDIEETSSKISLYLYVVFIVV